MSEAVVLNGFFRLAQNDGSIGRNKKAPVRGFDCLGLTGQIPPGMMLPQTGAFGCAVYVFRSASNPYHF